MNTDQGLHQRNETLKDSINKPSWLRAFVMQRLNIWIVGGLIVANLFAWMSLLAQTPEPYLVDALRDPEVVALLEYIRSGEHSGENWQVTLTELEAEQTITWYLQRYPQIPFAYPRVEITPDYISGKGEVTLSGLRVHVGGKARITLVDGLPLVEIIDLSLPLPHALRIAIEREIQIHLQRAELLPVRFTSAEWGDGVVIVQGVIKCESRDPRCRAPLP